MVDASECGSLYGVVVLVDGPRGRGTFLYVLKFYEVAFKFPLLETLSLFSNYWRLLSDVSGKYPPVGFRPPEVLPYLVDGVLALAPFFARMGCADTNMLPPMLSRSQEKSQSTWIPLTRLLPQTPTSTSRPDPLGG